MDSAVGCGKMYWAPVFVCWVDLWLKGRRLMLAQMMMPVQRKLVPMKTMSEAGWIFVSGKIDCWGSSSLSNQMALGQVGLLVLGRRMVLDVNSHLGCFSRYSYYLAT